MLVLLAGLSVPSHASDCSIAAACGTGARVYGGIETDAQCTSEGAQCLSYCMCPTGIFVTGEITVELGSCSGTRKLVYCQDFQDQNTSQVVCSSCAVAEFGAGTTALNQYTCDPISCGDWRYRLRVYDVTNKAPSCYNYDPCGCDPTSGCNNCGGNVVSHTESCENTVCPGCS